MTFLGLPVVTAAQMRELDRLAGERYGLPAAALMENAGRAVASETLRFLREKLKRQPAQSPMVVCCGRGGKGGDGLVAARVLREKGVSVSVFLCPPRKEEGAAEGRYPEPVRLNLERALAAGVTIVEAGPDSGLKQRLKEAALAVDALLGTGAKGKPAGAIHHMISELAACGKPVLSIDIPSGLDPDTGDRGGACVAAAATFTLALAKKGLLAPQAKRFVGELRLIDIGFPKELLAELAGG